jgi:excisionase family DNA binding protein
METLSFEALPGIVAEMNRKIDLLLAERQPQAEKDELFTLEQLQNYLPENPAKQTIYGWVNNRLIPFEKHGKRLYFRKSEVNEWLENGRKI